MRAFAALFEELDLVVGCGAGRECGNASEHKDLGGRHGESLSHGVKLPGVTGRDCNKASTLGVEGGRRLLPTRRSIHPTDR
jgi:hypothetical protein